MGRLGAYATLEALTTKTPTEDLTPPASHDLNPIPSPKNSFLSRSLSLSLSLSSIRELHGGENLGDGGVVPETKAQHEGKHKDEGARFSGVRLDILHGWKWLGVIVWLMWGLILIVKYMHLAPMKMITSTKMTLEDEIH
ncbi:uncharacterized protein LOC131160333 [Malania oleifera]|uniref:uncharacterized protein LOC131160333 n=1 Tax=Malania oleifera TaxID=397392 RepID=UPI0025AE6476|nr:uncharacterized protein LOC131160333 [Malania oleifera]